MFLLLDSVTEVNLFVYLRDNLLSTLEGVEILKRVKVLDLSFNDFKGPGFEPLENCKAYRFGASCIFISWNVMQLYLAGNQITSLISLPLLPNLEFLSVAQNKLKSLSMASQPRLQVLAASKNKISTLKGFPYLPVLERIKGHALHGRHKGLLEPKDKPHFECIIGKETHGSLIDDFTKLYILIVRWDAPSIGFLAWLVKCMERKRGVGVLEHQAKVMGNGRRVRFWKDKWCGEDTLGEAFPQLYSIAFVKDPWESNGGLEEGEEESTNHILFHCLTVAMLWEEKEEDLGSSSLMLILDPWKEGNLTAFDDSDLADQAILRVQVR
ncbi:microtubule-associated protein AIR9 [Vitis vinifera]|uniref:Microtubule-associated protein AIR9 n=1 Tax=Vitis vinifera TaxID=29760 RepID=A0A438DVP4_VITVI|nr:microtubule-associated protein AIR9 [Vitis vinifera]